MARKATQKATKKKSAPAVAAPTVLTPVEGAISYASAVHLQWAGNDPTLIFQRSRPATEPDGSICRTAAINEVTVMLQVSPGTLKDLMLILQDTLAQYENEFGEITTPFTRRKSSKTPTLAGRLTKH